MKELQHPSYQIRFGDHWSFTIKRLCSHEIRWIRAEIREFALYEMTYDTQLEDLVLVCVSCHLLICPTCSPRAMFTLRCTGCGCQLKGHYWGPNPRYYIESIDDLIQYDL